MKKKLAENISTTLRSTRHIQGREEDRTFPSAKHQGYFGRARCDSWNPNPLLFFFLGVSAPAPKKKARTTAPEKDHTGTEDHPTPTPTSPPHPGTLLALTAHLASANLYPKPPLSPSLALRNARLYRIPSDNNVPLSFALSLSSPPPRLPPTCPSSIFLSLAHVKALLPEDQILKGTSGARLQAADAGCGGQPHEETRCARKNI